MELGAQASGRALWVGAPAVGRGQNMYFSGVGGSFIIFGLFTFLNGSRFRTRMRDAARLAEVLLRPVSIGPPTSPLLGRGGCLCASPHA